MREIHVWSDNFNGSYGGCYYINGLSFFDGSNNELPIKSIVAKSGSANKEATITLENGLEIEVYCPRPYDAGSYYKIEYLTSKSTSTFMLSSQTTASNENRGFYLRWNGRTIISISFKHPSSYEFYSLSASVDGKDIARDVVKDENNLYKLSTHRIIAYVIACVKDKNGQIWFKRPVKEVENEVENDQIF